MVKGYIITELKRHAAKDFIPVLYNILLFALISLQSYYLDFVHCNCTLSALRQCCFSAPNEEDSYLNVLNEGY